MEVFNFFRSCSGQQLTAQVFDFFFTMIEEPSAKSQKVPNKTLLVYEPPALLLGAGVLESMYLADMAAASALKHCYLIANS